MDGSPVETVLGGNKKAQKFTKGLGLRTVGDLLRHFPRRYLPTGTPTKIEQLHEGELLTVVGTIVRSEVKSHTDRRTGRAASRLEAYVATDGPQLQMTFFAKSPRVTDYQAKRLSPGTKGIFLGKAGRFRNQWQLTNPQMVLFPRAGEKDVDKSIEAMDAAMSVEELTDLFPIYPLTAGLESWDVMRAVRFALMTVEPEEVLPEAVRRQYGLPSIREAYEWIHRPASYDQVKAAQRRFRFEEALTLQLVLGRRRREQQAQGATARAGGGDLLERFDDRLPFELTRGQQEVGAELEHDLAQPHPMNRLLQGEVGSGKTLVALRAMLRVLDSGGQAALLAPTEVLAQQHHRSITAMLGDLVGGGLFGDSTVELLTGSMTKTQRAPVLSRILAGEAGIVIGTHALLQEQVKFYDLGLVVVDEQHRFGVEQRSALTAKAATAPHVLVMTATPIPRTVAMTVFGDLDVSTLTELPAGRAPIQTTLVPVAEQPHWLDRVWERVREEVSKGHQAYVVAPRINGDQLEIGESDALDLDEDGMLVITEHEGLAAVEELSRELVEGALRGLQIGILHGRLTAEAKERAMSAFAAGDLDVLVSTTVIEVGVDVANATAMVVMDADRFGVSQLHQLRGRVGRGGHPGLCLLVSSVERGSSTFERLEAVARTTDGFELSRVDLGQRREGDVLGTSQSGYRSSLDNLRVLRDEQTIVEARGAAEQLLDDDPGLSQSPALADTVAAIERSAAADYMEMN